MDYKLKERYNLYIDGQWIPASDGGFFTASNGGRSGTGTMCRSHKRRCGRCGESRMESVSCMESDRTESARFYPDENRRPHR